MKTPLFLILFLGLTLTACNSPKENPDTDVTENTTEPPKTSEKANHNDMIMAAAEAFINGDSEALNMYLADDFVFSGPSPEPMGKHDYIMMGQSMVNAFSDLDNNFKLTGSDGDKIMATVQMQGNHTGDWDLSAMGMGVVKPTNKSFKLPEEKVTMTVKDGKLATFNVDVPEGGGVAGILAQLGIDMPKPKGK